MNEIEVLKKIKDIFMDVIGFDGDLKKELSPQNLKQWDSLGHINILMAVQMEFNIEFDMEEIQKINSVGELVDAILGKNN